MKVVRATLTGVFGGALVFAIVLAAGAVSNHHADLSLLLGSSITAGAGAWTWAAGAAAQLMIAVIAALLYAAIFEWITRRAGALLGLAVALGHVVIAGLGVGFLPASRLLESGISPPGAFLEYRGLLVAGAFVVAHLLFGVLVGAAYGVTRHALPTTRAEWRDVPVES
jgi:hypothetical protein